MEASSGGLFYHLMKFSSPLRLSCCLVASTLFVSGPLPGLNIVLDYTYDISDGGDFFGNNSSAFSALEQAATDLETYITTTLDAISSDPIVGNFGGSSFEIDARYSFTNPVTGASVDLFDTASLGFDEFRIYVGTRNLSGSTLGQGGPGGVGFATTGSGFEGEWINTVANAESQFNTQYQRGGGPTFSSFLDRSSTLGSTTANYDLIFGPSLGHLWFDVDSDNNGVTDDSVTLGNYWHFDHTVDPASGKNDFYSVALHEMLHALGIGTADTWDDNVVETGGAMDDWSGPSAISEFGTGNALIDGDSGHIAEDVMSTTVVGSDMQEVVMDPNIIVGTRKELTRLDLAFLEDIGWDVTYTAIPEPRIYGLALGLGALGLIRLRRRRGGVVPEVRK